MTRVRVHPGACGFTVTVEVTKKGEKGFAVQLETECEMVAQLAGELGDLTMMDAFKRFLDNPVYRKAATCLRHVACPVPSGILKALEVEAGLNVPKNVTITFLDDSEETGKS